MKRQMSKNQEKIEIFNAAPSFRKSLLYTSSTKSPIRILFDTSFAKKYLHFSHTWLDNKYSIFAIRYIDFFFILIKFWYWKYQNGHIDVLFRTLEEFCYNLNAFDYLKFFKSSDWNFRWFRKSSRNAIGNWDRWLFINT